MRLSLQKGSNAFNKVLRLSRLQPFSGSVLYSGYFTVHMRHTALLQLLFGIKKIHQDKHMSVFPLEYMKLYDINLKYEQLLLLLLCRNQKL